LQEKENDFDFKFVKRAQKIKSKNVMISYNSRSPNVNIFLLDVSVS